MATKKKKSTTISSKIREIQGVELPIGRDIIELEEIIKKRRNSFFHSGSISFAKKPIPQKEDIERQALTDVLDMRKLRSRVILGCIVFIILSNTAFLYLMGLNVIDNENIGDDIIIGYITQSVLQLFGLGYLVVRFLFNKESTS